MKAQLYNHKNGQYIGDVNIVMIPRENETIVWEGEQGHRWFRVHAIAHQLGANKAQIVTIVGEEQ